MLKAIIILCLSLVFYSCAQNKALNALGSSNNIGTDSTLDIITWNIEHFPKQGDVTVEYLLELINFMNVDVIAMQEIWSDQSINSFENIKNKLDKWDGYRKSSGLAYLYKTELVLNSLSEISELNDMIRTPYLLSINFNGQNIFIINNHFKCCGDGILDYNNESDEEKERYNAANLLKDYIDSNLSDENVIVLGDLNDQLQDDESNNVFQNFITDSMNYIFVDMNIALGPSDNWSYPGWPSHLDHILITNELFDEFINPGSRVETIHIEDYFEWGWNEYDNFVSDHLPVVLSLNFNP